MDQRVRRRHQMTQREARRSPFPDRSLPWSPEARQPIARCVNVVKGSHRFASPLDRLENLVHNTNWTE